MHLFFRVEKTGVVISEGRYYTLHPVERSTAVGARNGRVAGREDPDLPPPRSKENGVAAGLAAGYEDDLGENAHVMVLRKAAYGGGRGLGGGKSTCALKGTVIHGSALERADR